MPQILCIGYSLTDTGRLKDVHMLDVRGSRHVMYVASLRTPETNKPSVAAATAAFLVKHYAEHVQKLLAEPELLIVGFRPQWLIRELLLTATLPATHIPLPLPLWRHPDHFCLDLTELFGLYSQGHVPGIMARAEGMTEDDLKKFKTLLEGWTEPCRDAGTDMRLATILATQLGLYPAGA